MKLSRKLMMISAATLMGVSPVMGIANQTNAVQAATKKEPIYKTYGKNSKVTPTKTMYFVDKNGKKTKKLAKKDAGNYIIWDVTKINGETYYAIQTDFKYWIPAKDTKGTVQYQDGKDTVTIKTNGNSVKVSQTATKKPVAKKTTTKKTTTKKPVAKKTTTDTKKSTKKTTTSKAYKVTNIETIRRTSVYDQNGKKVSSYMGSKKYATIGKNISLKGLGTKTIKGTKYYALTPNRYYILASDVKTK